MSPQEGNDARALQSRLAQIDHLHASGMLSDQRHATLRQELIEGIAVATEPAWQPPVQRTPAAPHGPSRLLVGLATGGLALIFGGTLAAATFMRNSGPSVATAAHGAVAAATATASPTPAAAPSPTATASAVPTAAPTPAPPKPNVGAEYLAAITPLNKAWSDFQTALDQAESAPASCTCPPGYFDARPVQPAYHNLVTTYQQTISALQALATRLSGRAATDCRTLVADQQTTLADLQAAFGGSSHDLAADQAADNRLDDAQVAEHGAAAALRRDLGLPPAS